MQLEAQDKIMTEYENQYIKTCKDQLNLNDTQSDCGMSNFSNQSGYPQ